LAYAYTQTPGNGTTRLFSVSFPFILRAHVKVYLGYDVAAGTGTELAEGAGFSWLSNTQIQTTVAPAVGATLTVIRKTPNGSQLVVWAPGSPPTQADLNTADLQSLYVIQEQADITASAVTTATTAAAAANAAIAAVAAALPYQPIAAVANIPASPTASQRIEISNTTGLGSFSPLSGKPAGFVGGTDVKARLIYGTPTAASWNWVDYFPVDPDGRYLTNTGLRNRIINGNFDVWQDGTTFTGNGYAADQWGAYRAGSTHTVTRQAFTLGQADVPGEPEFFCRTVVSSVVGAGNYSVMAQRIEDVRTFAGQQVTVSFWAKADAARSIAVELIQFFGTGGSFSAEVNGIGTAKVSIGTSWQKVTVTVTLPSISGKVLGTNNDDYLVLNIWLDGGSIYNARNGSLGQQSGTFDIAQVQIELGAAATPFERPPLEFTLMRCQRYYQRGTSSFNVYGTTGWTYSLHVPLKVSMRTTPTMTQANSSLLNVATASIYGVNSEAINIEGTLTAPGNGFYTSAWTASARF